MEFLFYKQLINQNPKAMNKSMDNKMISSSLILNKMEILSTMTWINWMIRRSIWQTVMEADCGVAISKESLKSRLKKQLLKIPSFNSDMMQD